MEGTDGRGKWTPVPEEYCGAEDQSAAYVPPWAPVTHYSTWSPSNTSPSWTSPPRHLSPRTDNPPPSSSSSSSFSALCPRQPRSSATPPPSRNQENRPDSYTAFWSSVKTDGIWRDDSRSHLVPPSYSAEVDPARLSCYTHMLLASLSGAVPRHEAVISPVTVNLVAAGTDTGVLILIYRLHLIYTPLVSCLDSRIRTPVTQR
ncbi:hypothetical protein PAMP_013102 [Pampus punctatissimus]